MTKHWLGTAVANQPTSLPIIIIINYVMIIMIVIKNILVMITMIIMSVMIIVMIIIRVFQVGISDQFITGRWFVGQCSQLDVAQSEL